MLFLRSPSAVSSIVASVFGLMFACPAAVFAQVAPSLEPEAGWMCSDAKGSPIVYAVNQLQSAGAPPPAFGDGSAFVVALEGGSLMGFPAVATALMTRIGERLVYKPLEGHSGGGALTLTWLSFPRSCGRGACDLDGDLGASAAVKGTSARWKTATADVSLTCVPL